MTKYKLVAYEEGQVQEVWAEGTIDEIIEQFNKDKVKGLEWIEDNDKDLYEQAIALEVTSLGELEEVLDLINHSWWSLELEEATNRSDELTSRVYKDENDHLVVSYAGIDESEYENITHEEFIKIVEEADAWNDIEPEIYENALEEVGLEYGNYDDPDEMWEDYLEAVRG